jgi:hypothetical protein
MHLKDDLVDLEIHLITVKNLLYRNLLIPSLLEAIFGNLLQIFELQVFCLHYSLQGQLLCPQVSIIQSDFTDHHKLDHFTIKSKRLIPI